MMGLSFQQGIQVAQAVALLGAVAGLALFLRNPWYYQYKTDCAVNGPVLQAIHNGTMCVVPCKTAGGGEMCGSPATNFSRNPATGFFATPQPT